MAARVQAAADELESAHDPGRSIGRFTPAEMSTALCAGKYGAFISLAAAGPAASVLSLTTSTMMPLATIAMAAPIAFGQHHREE